MATSDRPGKKALGLDRLLPGQSKISSGPAVDSAPRRKPEPHQRMTRDQLVALSELTPARIEAATRTATGPLRALLEAGTWPRDVPRSETQATLSET